MSRFIDLHDFYRDGYNDMLSEVQDLQAQGLWTKERRASVARHEVSTYHACKHKYPRMDVSYWAGRLAAIKSNRTAPPKPRIERHGKIVFIALKALTETWCLECGERATWQCSTNGRMTSLCDRCKQERVREQTAYITPSGWDWDEHELLPWPVPPNRQLMQLKESDLELAKVAFPLGALLACSLSNILYPAGHLSLLMELVFVVLVRWQSASLVRFLISLHGFMEREKPF